MKIKIFNQYKKELELLDCELYKIIEQRNLLTDEIEPFDNFYPADFSPHLYKIIVKIFVSKKKKEILLNIFFPSLPTVIELKEYTLKKLEEYKKNKKHLKKL